MGVRCDDTKNINDGVTDHFVVITGRGFDEVDKAYYYTYVETGRSNPDIATDPEENRFYYNEFLDQWVDDDTYRRGVQYIMTQVRPNDGETSNTTPQPSKK
ncbi:MAG: hypothetical protein HUJ96_08230 [Marinilabiliaceae bacterium]|nr:hypothetical protein [Marinilabiliaceae bacterium]